MSRHFISAFLFVVAAATLFSASAVSALVEVDLDTTETGPVMIGDTFDVDVVMSWDGSGSLIGIFSSHEWDSSQLMLTNVVFPLASAFETRPVPLKGGAYDPALTRFGTIANGVAGDDLSSTARTVSYGSLTALNGATSQRPAGEIITRLTFEVVGAGDGTAEIMGVLLQGDIGADGDAFAFGPPVALTVPEAGSALLALSSLASVFAVVAIRRRA